MCKWTEKYQNTKQICLSSDEQSNVEMTMSCQDLVFYVCVFFMRPWAFYSPKDLVRLIFTLGKKGRGY